MKITPPSSPPAQLPTGASTSAGAGAGTTTKAKHAGHSSHHTKTSGLKARVKNFFSRTAKKSASTPTSKVKNAPAGTKKASTKKLPQRSVHIQPAKQYVRHGVQHNVYQVKGAFNLQLAQGLTLSFNNTGQLQGAFTPPNTGLVAPLQVYYLIPTPLPVFTTPYPTYPALVFQAPPWNVAQRHVPTTQASHPQGTQTPTHKIQAPSARPTPARPAPPPPNQSFARSASTPSNQSPKRQAPARPKNPPKHKASLSPKQPPQRPAPPPPLTARTTLPPASASPYATPAPLSRSVSAPPPPPPPPPPPLPSTPATLSAAKTTKPASPPSHRPHQGTDFTKELQEKFTQLKAPSKNTRPTMQQTQRSASSLEDILRKKFEQTYPDTQDKNINTDTDSSLSSDLDAEFF